MTPDSRRELQQRLESALRIPMLMLSLAFLVVLVLPPTLDLSAATMQVLESVNWMIWAVFAAELVINTYLAERRRQYPLNHWFDVLVVVLPMLRPLRLVRSLRLLRLVQAVRLLSIGARLVTTTREILTKHSLHHVLSVALILVVASAAAIAHVERDSGGSINGFADGLWWALTTVTTVGYGDTFPITPEGRGIGVFLMILGIALFGTVTASVASVFVSRGEAHADANVESVVNQLNRLEAKVDELLKERSSSS